MPASITARPSDDEFAPYYARYIRWVPNGDLLEIATKQVEDVSALLRPLSPEQWQHRYAVGKWSVLEVLGHLIDTERVFTYRAAVFSRQDPAPLPPFDQAAWTPFGEYDARESAGLIAEWETTRRASIAFMHGLPVRALARRGVASSVEFSVLAALCVAVGHVSYHLDSLRRDYLEGTHGTRAV
jgi:hypothetical protein